MLIDPIRSPSFFLSCVATTALIEVLARMAVAHGGPSVIRRIGQRQELRRASGIHCEE